jgi:hypothetical protein
MVYAGVAGILVALPVAILAFGAWLATPAYTKSIPATLTLIAVRLRLEGEARLGENAR